MCSGVWGQSSSDLERFGPFARNISNGCNPHHQTHVYLPEHHHNGGHIHRGHTMKIGRKVAVTALALLAIGITVTGSGTAGAAAPSRTQANRTTSDQIRAQLAVRGPNGHVWTSSTLPGAAFYDIGGRVLSTPAIAWSDRTYASYYVAIGTDHALWVHSNLSFRWSRLVAGTAACRYAPAVNISGDSLVVACVGLHSTDVYVGAATLPVSGDNPTVTGLRNSGAQTTGSPVLTRSDGQSTLWFLSTPTGVGNLYSHTLSSAFGQRTAWHDYCAARPGVIATTGHLVGVGCQNFPMYQGAGRWNTMRWGYGANGGVDGTMQGPADAVAAANGPGSAAFFVTDSHGVVWMKAVSNDSAGSFTRVGGRSAFGVSATLFR